MTWEIFIEGKKRLVTATITSSYTYTVTISVDGTVVDTYSGAQALQPHQFSIDNTECSIRIVPDFFKPTPLLTVGGEAVGTSFREADEKSKISSLKLVIALIAFSLIINTIRLFTATEQTGTVTAVLTIAEPLFVITTIIGFLQTRHPFFGKLLRLYFLGATLLFAYSIFDGKPGTSGGAITPILFILVSLSVTGLQRYPEQNS